MLTNPTILPRDNFGTNWTSNKDNDDLMWMVIASARAFLVSSNTAYKDLAKFNFNETYARVWSTNLDGGLWWTTNNNSKNACVNGPGAIAACYLYQILGDPSYLDKAKAVYAWERKNLFDESSGAVRDNMRVDGRIGGRALTYNEGTFIGAANVLSKLTGEKTYVTDAEKAVDYTRDKLCVAGILPGYGGGDGAGFNGIFVRWLARCRCFNLLVVLLWCGPLQAQTPDDTWDTGGGVMRHGRMDCFRARTARARAARSSIGSHRSRTTGTLGAPAGNHGAIVRRQSGKQKIKPREKARRGWPLNSQCRNVVRCAGFFKFAGD